MIRGLDLGVNGDFVSRQQASLEVGRLPRRNEEAELVGGPVAAAPRSDPAPWDLQRIEMGAAVGYRDNPQGTTFDTCQLVNGADRPFRNDDLAGHARTVQLLRGSVTAPHQLRGDIRIIAAAGEHRPHVLIGSKLPTQRRHLPQFSLYSVPDFSTREPNDLGARQPVSHQLVIDELRLVESPRILFRKTVAVVSARGHDRVPRGFTRRFTDDLVHYIRGKQGPLVERSHLSVGCRTGRQRESDRQVHYPFEHSEPPTVGTCKVIEKAHDRLSGL